MIFNSQSNIVCQVRFGYYIYKNYKKQKNMSHQVGRPKAETENVGVERKTAKDLGQPVDRIKAQPEGETPVTRKEAEGVSEKIQRVAHNVKERVMGSEHKNDQNSAMNKMSAKVDEVKQKMMPNDENKAMMKKDENMMKQNDEMDWTERYKSTDANIRKQLKKGNNDLTSQLEKVYQGMLKNCLKQAEDEPHKLQNCMEEFNTKMAPIYKKMQERGSESAATLKKCFESKKNAEECMQEGIRFGQQTLHDATNSIKSYLA